MKPFYKGLLLALLHMAIVCSLGAKLLYDRAHRPRVWIKAASYDPDLPIRGRYLSVSIEVPAEGFNIRQQLSPYQKDKDGKPLMLHYLVPNRGELVLRNGQMIAIANDTGHYWVRQTRALENASSVIVNTESTYFLPEHARDPSHLQPGQELWVEATIPRKGPPRPIRLAVKQNDTLSPIE
jgi:hypothetical protein